MIGVLFVLALAVQNCPPAAEADAWFCSQREVDLTGDGVLDTVRIRATGARSDNLAVELLFIVGDRVAWRERWHSDYMLIDPPAFPRGEPDRAKYVVGGLKQTLGTVRRQVFNRETFEMMGERDVVLPDPPPEYEVAYFYGYESNVVLIWDPERGAFSLLWTCC